MSHLYAPSTRIIRVTPATTVGPPAGRRWILLGGCVVHVTATASTLNIRGDGDFTCVSHIGLVIPSGTFLLGKVEEITIVAALYLVQQPSTLPLILKRDYAFAFSGDANAYCLLEIAEIEDPKGR